MSTDTSLPKEQKSPKFEQCPDCRGLGYYELPVVCHGCDPDSEEHQHVPERHMCATCHGAKVLSGLALAVRKARGGPPQPLPMRGFA